MGFDATVPLFSAEPSLHTVPTMPGPKATREAKARAQATEFEQVYLATMMKQMFAGLSTEAPFGGGQAEESWRGILIDQYADGMVKAGGVGIADAVYHDLLAIQEGTAR